MCGIRRWQILDPPWIKPGGGIVVTRWWRLQETCTVSTPGQYFTERLRIRTVSLQDSYASRILLFLGSPVLSIPRHMRLSRAQSSRSLHRGWLLWRSSLWGKEGCEWSGSHSLSSGAQTTYDRAKNHPSGGTLRRDNSQSPCDIHLITTTFISPGI